MNVGSVVDQLEELNTEFGKRLEPDADGVTYDEVQSSYVEAEHAQYERQDEVHVHGVLDTPPECRPEVAPLDADGEGLVLTPERGGLSGGFDSHATNVCFDRGAVRRSSTCRLLRLPHHLGLSCQHSTFATATRRRELRPSGMVGALDVACSANDYRFARSPTWSYGDPAVENRRPIVVYAEDGVAPTHFCDPLRLAVAPAVLRQPPGYRRTGG
ncbi:MAG: hypothetical protein ABEK29_02915 [Bradymonadaceae bacterium]